MTQHVAHRKSDEIHELRAEIERLNGIEATGRKMWHEAQAEIERLRREIGIWKSLGAQYEKPLKMTNE